MSQNDMILCRGCSIEKPCSEFSKVGGIRKQCKECKNKYNTDYRATKDGKLRILLGDAKKNHMQRFKNEAFTLTFKDLHDKWNTQNQKCYISGMEMHYDKRKWQVSLERLDTTKGYTKENTALCCLEFNNQAQWSHEKVDDMIMNIELSEKIKPISPAAISNKTSDMYFHLTRLLDRCVIKSEEKNRLGSSDLTIDSLIELFKKQNGKCAYSNIPLRCGTSQNSWIASLNRINPLVGYIKSNVCLTCLEFNTIDHTSTYSDIREDESSGWSKEKIIEWYEVLKQTQRFNDCIRRLPQYNTDIKLDVILATCVHCKKEYHKKAKYTYRQKCEDCIKTHNLDEFECKNEQPLDQIMRVCTKCNIEKGLKDFSKSATSSLGYNTICKYCKNQRNQELRKFRVERRE